MKVNCFCNAVEIEVKGEPLHMGYCHCKDCSAWSATPITSYSFWEPRHVKIIKGNQYVQTFYKTGHSLRKFCKKCGGHIMNEHPDSNLLDVFAVILKGLSFKPTMHVNYASKTISIKDGLPKFKDLPKEFNGSGEIIPE